MPQAKHAYITPSLPRALPPAARRKVEMAAQAHADALAALVAFLDAADGDPDLEPSLASTVFDRCAPETFGLDLEEQSEDEGTYDSDREPSLGALLNHHKQTGWANGNCDDVEDALAHG
jgi:hypothetical protein